MAPKTYYLEKRDSKSAVVSAKALRLGDDQALLDLSSQVDDQIFGVELSCNKSFQIFVDGSPQNPVEKVGKFVHTLDKVGSKTSVLPGRGRTRSYRLKFTDWRPQAGEALKCNFNDESEFSVKFD